MATLPTINLGGNLPPEILGQQQQLNRQQQMAQLLMQQGQQMPQSQMVSGRYVAPSFFQNIAPLVQGYVGTKLAKKGDKQALELAAKLRQRYGDELEQFRKIQQGQEAVADQPQKTTELAGPYGEMVGQGNVNIPMPTATMPAQVGRAAIPANPQGAYDFAARADNPALQAVGIKNLTPEAFTLNEGAKRFITMPDGTSREIAAGGQKLRAPLQIDTGTAIELRDPNNPTIVLQRIPKSISPADAARMQFEGITGGGMPMGNVPTGGMPMANAPAQQMNNVVAPSAQPQYQYNPTLSPKENQTRAAKFIADADKNLKNAQESFNVIKDAADLFNTGQPTSGGLKNIRTGVAEFFDIPTQAADADARLEILGQKLVQQVPRFEGPQSDKDVASYKAAAGDLGNASKTITTRISALNTLIDLNKKYYPQGNWDSIDLAGPVTTRQTFLKGQQKIDPATFSQGLNAQDKEAFNWARKNPTDPRAAQINQRLGIR
jgi:hypothetical protein